jgi:peptide/nickel transport system ATP-binding protein
VESKPLLAVHDLRICAGETELVHGLSFQLAAGESLGLVGASGSGKSLTTLALLGLLPDSLRQSGGSIQFAGQSLTGLSERAWRGVRGGRIGLVFQDPSAALNPVLRVGFQVEEVLAAHGIAGGRDRVRALFAEVQLTQADNLLDRFPHELSGGQRQRVMIAIALAGEPELLLADEPTTALDVTVQAAILELVARIQRERGLAMLWISHDLAVIARVCDRVAILDEGELVEVGSVQQILQRPKSAAAQRLLAALPRSARVHLTQMPDPQAQGASSPAEGVPAVLKVEDLSVRFPARRDWLGRVQTWQTVVDQVSLEVPCGQTLALVGESGSGKSSLGRAVLRLVPAEGRISLQPSQGAPIDLMQVQGGALRAARRRLGVVFQDPSRSLNPRLRIGTSVCEPLRVHKACPRGEMRERAQAMLLQVGLEAEMVDRFPGELSGGQKQRVAIARALSLRPDLVICDEAVSALDVAVQAQVLQLLKDLQAETGTSYLFITHDLAVVEDFADQVAVMQQGKIVERGPVAQVFHDPQHAYTQRLLAASPRLPALS